jgi:putative ABC transport system permease protein
MSFWTDVFPRELRIAVRSLRQRPAFTIVASVTLAIGIGANTSIFSVVNGVLLQPLPYAEPDQLVVVGTAGPDPRILGSMSFPDMADIRDQGKAFRTLVGYGSTSFTLTELGEPTMVDISRVTEGLMATFHLTPLLGRDIRRDEFGVDAPSVVVISEGLWRDRLGGRSDVIGRSIVLNSQTYEIIGVAPAALTFPTGAHVWMPRRMDPVGCGRDCHNFRLIGRLADGATLQSATAELERFGVTFEASYPRTNTGKRFVVRGLKDSLVGNVSRGLWIMLGAVGFVLLIACANVTSLLLARASAREGEIAIRTALGATRAALARQVLVESGVLATIGGALGVLVAVGGVAVLRKFTADMIPRADRIAIDTTVLVVTLASVVFVTLAFGLVPAFELARRSVAAGLASMGRAASATRRTVRFRRTIVGVEVALSAMLLIGAGLLLKTFSRLYRVDVGFETHEILRFNLVLPQTDYPELERASQFYREVETRVGQLPGVAAVGAMYGAPAGSSSASGSVFVEGRPAPQPGEEQDAGVHPMTPGLFAALGLRLIRGRVLTDEDNRRDAEPVALVTEEFARQHFPNENPLDRRFRITVNLGFGSPYWRIVGVVADVRFETLTSAARAHAFMPQAQYGPLSMTVHVRGEAGYSPSPNVVREAIRSIDPRIPLHRVETIERVIGKQIAPTRLYLLLVAVFAVTAAVLAAVGLYGVMAFVGIQRTREIGVRMALGARREGIVALLVSEGMRPVAVGLMAGITGALAGGRFMEAILFRVEPRDPLVFVSAAGLMILVAVAAAVIPALRASGVNPAVVLRGDG